MDGYPMKISKVAPRAGAWIETDDYGGIEGALIVAPRAGAWIETVTKFPTWRGRTSHPVRVRGLKRGY